MHRDAAAQPRRGTDNPGAAAARAARFVAGKCRIANGRPAAADREAAADGREIVANGAAGEEQVGRSAVKAATDRREQPAVFGLEEPGAAVVFDRDIIEERFTHVFEEDAGAALQGAAVADGEIGKPHEPGPGLAKVAIEDVKDAIDREALDDRRVFTAAENLEVDADVEIVARVVIDRALAIGELSIVLFEPGKSRRVAAGELINARGEMNHVAVGPAERIGLHDGGAERARLCLAAGRTARANAIPGIQVGQIERDVDVKVRCPRGERHRQQDGQGQEHTRVRSTSNRLGEHPRFPLQRRLGGGPGA